MKKPRLRTGRRIAPQRIVNLTDAVFAIVMTILVLELSVPLLVEISAHDGQDQMLLELRSDLLIYALSYLILGVFWLAHHWLFENIKKYDSTLAWMNLIFLLFVALIPFSMAILGEYGVTQAIARIYGANMLLPFFMIWLMWLYATVNYRLVDSHISRKVVKGGRIMGASYVFVILFAIGISFISPVASFAIYALIIVVNMVFAIIGREEEAMVG
ncbi:MAG: DUF1211 domain-containing protein [Dehalococcoidia bacterium]|nr:DUF1211 domain-containing protein [Dehalococcoidia bacterium]